MKNNNSLDLQDHTSTCVFKHQKVFLKDVFSDEFLKMTKGYVNTLSQVLQSYDVVIFMARKAICFYKALVANGELEKEYNCKIYSSRMLEYDLRDIIRDKKVALVDDVVVKGDSISQAYRLLIKQDIIPDVYIAAVSDAESKSDNDDVIRYSILHSLFIKNSFAVLNETSVYKFASYITRYIEASMVPYNMDQPIYLLEYESEDDALDFLLKHRTVDITSAVQKRFSIENRVIHLDPSIFASFLEKWNVALDSVVLKIRVLKNSLSNQILIFPVALLPFISAEATNEMFCALSNEYISKRIHNDNEQINLEGKYKFVLFALNTILIERFIEQEIHRNVKVAVTCLESNEELLYGVQLLDESAKASLSSVLAVDKNGLIEKAFNLNKFDLIEYLGAIYAFIFHVKEPLHMGEFFNYKNEKLNFKVYTHRFIAGLISLYKQEKAKFNDNIELIKEDFPTRELLVSNILDILIDRGTLVPTIVHSKQKYITRAFKCGEIAKLSEKEFELFGYMLSKYISNEWVDGELQEKQKEDRLISFKEIENICVLFFKKAAKEGCFETLKEQNNFDVYDDYYSICYTLYGNIISRTFNRNKYMNTRIRLSAVMFQYGYIFKVENGKYKLPLKDTDYNLDKKWKEFADDFVYQFLFLKQSFPDETTREKFLYSIESTEQYSLGVASIKSYNQALSILAIGENEARRALSLMPAIKLIADMRIVSVDRALHYIDNNLDGFMECIWLALCCNDKNIINNIKDLLCFKKSSRDKHSISTIFQNYIERKETVDKTFDIISFISECSDLIYRTYYIAYSIQSQHQLLDLSESPHGGLSKGVFTEGPIYEKARNDANAELKTCSTLNEKERFARYKALFERVNKEATAFMDIFDLYTKGNTFSHDKYNTTILLNAETIEYLQGLRLGLLNLNVGGAYITECQKDNKYFGFLLYPLSHFNESDQEGNTLENNLGSFLSKLSPSLNPMNSDYIPPGKINLVIYQSDEWYNAIFSNRFISKGKFAEQIYGEILSRQRECIAQNHPIELLICSKKKLNIKECLEEYVTITDLNSEYLLKDVYNVRKYSISFKFNTSTVNNYNTTVNQPNGCAVVNNVQSGQISGINCREDENYGL